MYNYFNFCIFHNKILATNNTGCFHFFDVSEFNQFISNPLSLNHDLKKQLKNEFFFVPNSLVELPNDLIAKTRINSSHLFHSTSLFIIVVDERCNSDCIYCQASCNNSSNRKRHMKLNVIYKILDFISKTPNRNVTIEFQGGEPLLSYTIISKAIEYMNSICPDKEISYSVVSNISLLTDNMAKFFKKNKVNISFSLDGNKTVHDYNRRSINEKSSYDFVQSALNILKANDIEYGAIQTTTRFSLPFHKQIIDSYVNKGLTEIFIRPLTKLGIALDKWNEVGYTAEEFIKFYSNCLKYIIDLNLNGILIKEVTASIFLAKIFGEECIDYMDLRSPCGACIGQMAFDPDGNIFSCDEGRMLSSMGDDSFKIGNIETDTYITLLDSQKCRKICKASIIESNITCSTCVYSPYCGICPVINLSETGDMASVNANSYRCKIYKGILDCIFEYFYSNDTTVTEEVFRKWIRV